MGGSSSLVTTVDDGDGTRLYYSRRYFVDCLRLTSHLPRTSVEHRNPQRLFSRPHYFLVDLLSPSSSKMNTLPIVLGCLIAVLFLST